MSGLYDAEALECSLSSDVSCWHARTRCRLAQHLLRYCGSEVRYEQSSSLDSCSWAALINDTTEGWMESFRVPDQIQSLPGSLPGPVDADRHFKAWLGLLGFTAIA